MQILFIYLFRYVPLAVLLTRYCNSLLRT